MEDHLKQENRVSALSYAICMLLGLGLLFPWSSMVTIMDYYLVVFPAYHPSRVLTLIYQASAFVTVAILAYHEAKVDTRFRVLSGFSLYFVSSLMVPIIDLASRGGGGVGPYSGLCVLCMLFGICDGLVQGGLVGDLSFMHPHLLQVRIGRFVHQLIHSPSTKSFSAGAGASGAATSGLRLVTKACFASTKNGLRKGALVFFFLSASFQLLCLLLYAVVFPKLEIIKNFRKAAALEGATTVGGDLAAADVQVDKENQGESPSTRLSNMQLLAQNLDYAFDAAAIFVLTLSIFPGFLAEDTGNHSLGSWYVVVLIASYNFGDLTGRYLPLVPVLKLKSRIQLLVAVIARYLFVPAFYVTAKFGDQGWMIVLCILLGLTNGHLTTSVLVAAPNGYKKPEQNALGNILVVFILAGVTLGVTLDWLWLIGKGW